MKPQDVNDAVTMAADQISEVSKMVSTSLQGETEAPKRLSVAEQVRRYATMTSDQRMLLRQHVGGEAFNAYEAAMRKLRAEGY